MAHDKCIGTWEKSKLDGVDDGKIRVDNHTGNTFTGKHLKTGASLENTSCDGARISFSRVDTSSSQRISYSGTIVPAGPAKVRIDKGRFSTSPVVNESAKVGADKKRRNKRSEDQPDQDGSWESEKVT